MRTTQDQVYTFGEYKNSGCRFQYLGSTPTYIVSEFVPLGYAVPAFGIATTSPKSLESCESPQPRQLSTSPSDLQGAYYTYASLNHVKCVAVYCNGRSCSGILITYSDGIQQALGQLRPDASRHEFHNPFGFHHQSKEVGGRRIEIVRISLDLQEYEDLVMSSWESSKVDNEPTWLYWWCNATCSFCSIIVR